jgi:hypothetical protein
MFSKYIESLLEKAIYEKDENGVVIAKIPWYAWYYTQGDTFEESRDHLIDLIETMVLDSVLSNEKKVIQGIRDFIKNNQVQYA